MSQHTPFIANCARRLLGRTITVTGLDNLPPAPPYVIVGNHTGFLDAVSLAVTLAPRTGRLPFFLTKETIWSQFARFLGVKGLKHLGILPIYKNHPGDVLAPAIEHLRHSGLIGVFPEGGIYKTDRLNRGKTGAIRLALAARCPIVPVGIKASIGGAKEALVHVLQRKPIHLNYGPAIDLRQWYDEPMTKPLLEELTTKVMRTVGELCGKSYRPE